MAVRDRMVFIAHRVAFGYRLCCVCRGSFQRGAIGCDQRRKRGKFYCTGCKEEIEAEYDR